MRRRVCALLSFLIFTVMLAPASALACVPVQFPRHAEYLGGDLFRQIARKAFQIDLFRVSNERLTGEAGQAPWSSNRRISEYALSIVSHEAAPLGFRLLPMPRQVLVRGYHPEAANFDAHRYPNVRQWLPPFAVEHPGTNRTMMPITPTTPERDNDCQAVFTMLPGAYVIVLRGENAELYRTDLSDDRVGQLAIDVTDGFGARTTIASPTLILLSGLNDPLLARMRAAIREERRSPTSIWPWLN